MENVTDFINDPSNGGSATKNKKVVNKVNYEDYKNENLNTDANGKRIYNYAIDKNCP